MRTFKRNLSVVSLQNIILLKLPIVLQRQDGQEMYQDLLRMCIAVVLVPVIVAVYVNFLLLFLIDDCFYSQARQIVILENCNNSYSISYKLNKFRVADFHMHIINYYFRVQCCLIVVLIVNELLLFTLTIFLSHY